MNQTDEKNHKLKKIHENFKQHRQQRKTDSQTDGRTGGRTDRQLVVDTPQQQ